MTASMTGWWIQTELDLVYQLDRWTLLELNSVETMEPSMALKKAYLMAPYSECLMDSCLESMTAH